MAKLPAFAKAFAGRWRIVEMDVWDKDFLDLVETAHLTFKGAADGEIAFGALKGFLDVRYGTRDGSASAEFSWEGNDENDPASGRVYLELAPVETWQVDKGYEVKMSINPMQTICCCSCELSSPHHCEPNLRMSFLSSKARKHLRADGATKW